MQVLRLLEELQLTLPKLPSDGSLLELRYDVVAWNLIAEIRLQAQFEAEARKMQPVTSSMVAQPAMIADNFGTRN